MSLVKRSFGTGLLTLAAAIAALGGCDSAGDSSILDSDATTETTSPGSDGSDSDAAVGDDGEEVSSLPDDATADGGAGPDVADDPAAAWCAGENRALYSPLKGKALETFPDDYYTMESPSSLTGIQVQMNTAIAPWLPAIPGAYSEVFEQLEDLDGFGTTAGVILRFLRPLGPVPSGEVGSIASESVRFIDLESGQRVPYEAELTDKGTTMILWPMVPLLPKHRYGVVVTTDALDADGACIAPSATLKELLTGTATDPRLTRLHERYSTLLAKAEIEPAAVSSAVVFTTQSIEETSVQIAKDIATRAYSWSTPVTCTTGDVMRTCEGRFLPTDYREGGVITAAAPVTTYELRVRVWLPLAQGPYPVLVFGHGLGGDKDQGEPLAVAAASMGLATIAVDSVMHGQHPAAASDVQLLQIMSFFGIKVESQNLDALVLRDNWRQSTYDKLQLVRLLTTNPSVNADFDGDSVSDIDATRFAYFGVSLGGIMGPELLALTDVFGAAILSVPGGRVSTIIRDADQFAVVIALMQPQDAVEGDVRRFFPVLQTLIERGDSSNYARYVTGKRLDIGGARHPQLLLNFALNDDTVPPGCNRSIARALGAPHLDKILEPIGIIPLGGGGPITGNVDDGKVTAGVFQFDRVTKDDGTVQVAKHSNVARSPEGIEQTKTFLQTWLDTGIATIVDPYVVLSTPALPAKADPE